jgi:hypothetical protein
MQQVVLLNTVGDSKEKKINIIWLDQNVKIYIYQIV